MKPLQAGEILLDQAWETFRKADRDAAETKKHIMELPAPGEIIHELSRILAYKSAVLLAPTSLLYSSYPSSTLLQGKFLSHL